MDNQGSTVRSAAATAQWMEPVGLAVCALQAQLDMQAAKRAAKFAELEAVAHVLTGLLSKENDSVASDREK